MRRLRSRSLKDNAGPVTEAQYRILGSRNSISCPVCGGAPLKIKNLFGVWVRGPWGGKQLGCVECGHMWEVDC